VPARTPAPAIAVLNAALLKAVRATDVVAGLHANYLEVTGSSPVGFGRFISPRMRSWAPSESSSNSAANQEERVKIGILEDASNVSAAASATNCGTLYGMLPGVRHAIDPAALLATAECAFAELARTGSTIFEGIESKVAGDADLLVMPDLNAGNMLYKSFVYVGGGECAGLVLGAMAPIVLTSRADSLEARIASVALASLAARH
jgi:hypothetical protein